MYRKHCSHPLYAFYHQVITNSGNFFPFHLILDICTVLFPLCMCRYMNVYVHHIRTSSGTSVQDRENMFIVYYSPKNIFLRVEKKFPGLITHYTCFSARYLYYDELYSKLYTRTCGRSVDSI